jgi:taurine--2-oxoglutarate transaminase
VSDEWAAGDPSERAPFFFTWSVQSEARPVPLAGGQGCWFETTDGARWLDLASFSYQANLGHGHPRMVAALERQAKALCTALPNAVFPAKRALAERLLAMAPEGFTKVFFTLGGAEAVENAIKMARLVTGRYKVVSRYRSYHGATLGALSLTGDYRRPPLEPALVGAVHALDCYCDRCPFGQAVASCQRECAKHIGELLRLEGAGSVAAVVLEPIPGANGVLVPPDGYWQRVRAACDEDGALLVADEVLTGFGRTGRWLAIEHEGVVPDLIVLAKGLTGGYATLGAVLVAERVARHFDDRFLYAGLTGYAHPLACAAALEAMAVYEEEGLVERAAALEAPLLAGLEAIRGRHPERVRFVRGRGLLAALELDCSVEASRQLGKALRARRVLTHQRHTHGPGAATVILSPPLCIGEDELALGLERVTAAFDEVFA